MCDIKRLSFKKSFHWLHKNYSQLSFFYAVIFLCLVPIFTSCGMKKMATNIIGSIATDGMVAVESEEDLVFAKASSPALIKTLEVLSYGNPRDVGTLTLLSKAYGQYAFGFLEDEILRAHGKDTELSAAKAKARLFYKRGRDFGLKSLTAKGPMKSAMQLPFQEFKRSLAKLGKKDVPRLFWTAFNWASYLNLSLEDPQAIADLPRIEAIIDRVIELDPKYYYGSAHTLKGVIAATRPKMLGGNPELADSEFQKAIGVSSMYLMTKVMYAEYYAKQIQDRPLFQRVLTEVLNADVKLLPEQMLANELALQRAKLLLSMEKELF